MSPILSKSQRNALLLAGIILCVCIPQLRAQSVVFSKMRNFTGSPDGAYPGALFPGADNAIYGVTWLGGDTNLTHTLAGGTLFKINRDGSGYTVLHSFSYPETQDNAPSRAVQMGGGSSGNIGISAVQGSDGLLYGTAQGTTGNGMVFKCNNDGNGFTVIHNFVSSPDGNPLTLIQGRDGVLYGTSWVAIFALDTQGGNYRVLHELSTTTNEGTFPMGRLLQASDGALYGTCALDNTGANPSGSIFKITTNGDFSVLHFFPATNGDGVEPVAGLIQGSDGALYGTTLGGGASSLGTVFKINTDGSGYKILHSFSVGDVGSSDGEYPYGELVQTPAALGGGLLGTTSTGANNDSNGTIFTIGLDGTGYNVLYNFPGTTNGVYPYAGLLPGATAGTNGLFYGTAARGGSGFGSLFTVLLPNPPLSITPVTASTASNQTVIFWPQWAANYKLQATTNIASANWVTVTDAVPVFGAQVTSTNPAVFYRLVSP